MRVDLLPCKQYTPRWEAEDDFLKSDIFSYSDKSFNIPSIELLLTGGSSEVVKSSGRVVQSVMENVCAKKVCSQTGCMGKEMWRVMALLRYAAYLHLVRGT